MKITKLGHCCLIIEEKGVRILTDPGAPDYSRVSDEVKKINVVLITHEHADHLHIESLKKVLAQNPQAVVITNTSVGKILDGENIPYSKVEDGQDTEIMGVKITGFGDKHAEIYETYGQVQNTGYMINNLCYPGDSFSMPNGKAEILALPVVGPWMKMKEAIEYAKKINPKVVFPVHDGVLHNFATFIYTIPEKFLGDVGIKFKKMELGKEEEF